MLKYQGNVKYVYRPSQFVLTFSSHEYNCVEFK